MIDRAANGPCVLVVDDEAGILESLRILLKNEGFTPHVALGGRQGLEQIESLAPDVVLSDIRMPAVGGLEILSAARQKDPDMPVILMTAQATLQTAMQAVNLPTTEDVEELRRKLSELEVLLDGLAARMADTPAGGDEESRPNGHG